MKFFLYKTLDSDNTAYTFAVLKKLIRVHGHELIEDRDQADMILVTICDIDEIQLLIRARRENKEGKPIAVGGHVCFNYKVVALFADLVNVGHGFEFFKCQTVEEMKALPCVYYPGKPGKITPSELMEWHLLPLVQKSKKTYYYMAGVGCKNKCAFCYTSWTNRLQKNSEIRVQKAYHSIPKGASLMIIANEYDGTHVKVPVKDMLLKDFIKLTSKTANIVKMGLEFATPETRKRVGKFFTDEEFLYILELLKN